MFSLSLDYQGFDALDAQLGELMLRAQDLRPLAETLREIMIEDNERRSLAGVDFRSVALAPLTTETLLTRKGTGPPLAPQGAASHIVADYTVEIHNVTPDVTTIVGTWPNAPWMRFHVTGYTSNRSGRFVPARDPAGLTPEGEEQVIAAFNEFVAYVLAALTAAA